MRPATCCTAPTPKHPALASPPQPHLAFTPFSWIPQGYSFVYLKSKKDGDYAIRKLDGMEWGRKRRPLKLQWAKVSRGLGRGPAACTSGYSPGMRLVQAARCWPGGAFRPQMCKGLPHVAPHTLQQREADRKRETKPTNTLFCVNFDVNRWVPLLELNTRTTPGCTSAGWECV